MVELKASIHENMLFWFAQWNRAGIVLQLQGRTHLARRRLARGIRSKSRFFRDLRTAKVFACDGTLEGCAEAIEVEILTAGVGNIVSAGWRVFKAARNSAKAAGIVDDAARLVWNELSAILWRERIFKSGPVGGRENARLAYEDVVGAIDALKAVVARNLQGGSS